MIQRLEELRAREKRLVESFRDEIKHRDPDCKIVYLPNLTPRYKARYIFIAMEPSFGRWAKDEEEAKRKIRNGFRNFILTWEDFILHYSISAYLSPLYHVTDVSQAAMKVKDANLWRERIYPRWIELLRQKIEIVGQTDCRLIFIGNKVEDFLKGHSLNREYLKTIMHYSGQAAKKRKEVPRRYPGEFKTFKGSITSRTILDFARTFLHENGIPPQTRSWILRRLKRKSTKLSDSRKELLFTYYKELQEIRV